MYAVVVAQMRAERSFGPVLRVQANLVAVPGVLEVGPRAGRQSVSVANYIAELVQHLADLAGHTVQSIRAVNRVLGYKAQHRVRACIRRFRLTTLWCVLQRYCSCVRTAVQRYATAKAV